MTPRNATPMRILFVFGWLVVGGEETEVRLLARHLDPRRYTIEVLACFRNATMPDQTHQQLAELGVPVDTVGYSLPFEATVEHLAGRLPEFDVVVGCQAVRDLVPALELAHERARSLGTGVPPLIEHGGLVAEALAGPKHLTARYVGVSRSIRDAAAARMPGRENAALEIPSMVDLDEFVPSDRERVRREWQVSDDEVVFGWVGRLDRKKRVEDVLEAAAVVAVAEQPCRLVIIGGPDAFMPDYADELRRLASRLGLDGRVTFLGDRADVPRLLGGLDAFVWLSRDEGMPHVIAEAGASRLPVIATRDNGTEEQIVDGESGLFVPHQDPAAVASAMLRLIDAPELRASLGARLRETVERDYSVAAVIPRWEALFDDVVMSR